ncbi:serine/threonine phosphatase [Phormidium sp. CLA17]|uniref:serine/threonine phosphatase n=1 Tax=Leptolyngbya sp. Cla-17 TaxID=2803751 RepID=UPI0014921186|nr:serine/threonine phosphatase [Leptolyngbya sp. Cla-17]MBM0741029.1 serine/threonine phosphatase [Leptolyngbya sp. Cla-17]
MLVCPHCQFENPTANKFCQKCGTSLVQNTCPECSSLVPFDQMNCQVCNAIAGVTWWAILSTHYPAAELAPSKDTAALATGSNGYLDLQQRYELTDALPAVDELGERQLQVLDCQPFQLSLLEALVLQQDSDETGSQNPALEFATPGAEGWTDSMNALAIPEVAQPYVALNRDLYPVLPAIHNAWKWNDQDVLLLEDRSHFPLLMDVWCDQERFPSLLQVLQWLYEMTELWHALEPWQCQQSVLISSNLRADVEDDTLLLQRLYPNPPGQILTLHHLGKHWQAMFAESQRTQLEPVSQFLADVEDGTLKTVNAVRSRIEAIADSLQPDACPPTQPLEPFISSVAVASNLDVNGTANQLTDPVSDGMAVTLPPEDDDPLDNDDMPTIVLPMQLFNLEEVGRTDVGRQRDHNEDYFGLDIQVSKLESPSGKTIHARNLYILCDGMGGHASGEVASALAVDTIRKYFKEKWQDSPFPSAGINDLPNVAMMTEAVLSANKAIYDVNQENACSGSGRMGTTLVVVLIQDTEVAVAHVGDSRLYRYTRKRGLEQVTVDHEVGQREIQRGVDPDVAYSRPDAYQLTQALGPRDEPFVKPDVQFFELNEDMILLLCSDGLSDNDLLENHWETHVQPLLSSQTNLDKGVGELIELANSYNGHDNISAIAIRAKVRPSLEHLR